MKRPSFQFYPSDWLRDTALRSCSVEARGLWIDMICFMHEGKPYGHLKVNSKAVSDAQLSRMCGGEVLEVKKWLDELESSGVLSRDSDGCIFSRRMIRDEELREIRAAGGKEGGNPKLMGGYNKPGFVYAMLRASDGAIKIGISQDPSKRLYKVRAQFVGDEITIIGKTYVQDMGSTEAELHKLFSSKKSGEWFSLNEKEVKLLLDVHLKANQTPSSASSSSSSTSLIKEPKGSSSAKLPDCPHESVIDLFAKHLPNLPQPRKSLWRKGKNAAALKSRWCWVMTENYEKGERKGTRMAETVEDGLAWFDRYFAYVAESDWLTGRAGDWSADLGWLVNSSNFEKVLQGNYANQKAQA